jgi:hypothetical protein
MTTTGTYIFRATLQGSPSIYRDIEIESAKPLYQLAEAIVGSFDFDLDHAFGFYTGLTPAKLYQQFPKYELFADMGDAEPGVLGVKKVKVSRAFPAVGHKMLFLFDYGDEWHFHIVLRATGEKTAKVRYPRIVATRGAAPAQYPDDENEDIADGAPTFGINPLTGEKIKIGK